jgi:hypothetical protein
MEPNKKINVLRYTLSRDQIMTFVGGLHDIQADMIEALVENKGLKGYPEANEVINHVRGLR